MSSCGAPRSGGFRSSRRSRRSRSRGGSAPLNEAFADLKGDVKPPAAAPAAAAPPAPAPAAGANGQKGGRRTRKGRKMSKGATAWTTAVTKLYREMKRKDKSAKFSDALKRASALKKKGEL